jgi:hypothetical protein
VGVTVAVEPSPNVAVAVKAADFPPATWAGPPMAMLFSGMTARAITIIWESVLVIPLKV